MTSKEEKKSPSSGCTLKKPIRVVKKRSGPLDEVLDEIQRETLKATDPEGEKNCSTLPSQEFAAGSSNTSTVGHLVNFPKRRLSHFKDREKKRERWLLTRKTWKYMTDAGRKLIPEGVQNRKEDIPKIEAHFQELCTAEPRFILWRRKSSYPGATRNSKRRLKQIKQHTEQKHSTPLTVEQVEYEEIQNKDEIINLLQSFLKIDETRKTTTLLGSKTVRPDQTSSPSAQRPSERNISRVTYSALAKDPLQQLSEVDQLLQRLKRLQRSATTPVVDIPPELITHDIFKDKELLKQIYNALKKQQLHRILSKHSNGQGFRKSHSILSLSLSNLNSPGNRGLPKEIPSSQRETRGDAIIGDNTYQKFVSNVVNVGGAKIKSTIKKPSRRTPPKTLSLTKKSTPLETRSNKSFSSCGVQTNFIQLQEIKRLAEEYKERKREETALRTGCSTTDDEIEKSTKNGHQSLIQRKSSIDNEDVSQSVSDTIKRYLRMARKKSVHETDANRFKRVNYDRNLRNIRAKGEINPPGMDEGNTKAVQTLDAWPLITLDFIRGNDSTAILEIAHTDWQRDLDERLKNKMEYEKKINEACDPSKSTKSVSRSCSSSSAPTSPTSPISNSSEKNVKKFSPGRNNFEGSPHNAITGGLFHSSTQFLSNLWHGGHQHDENASKNNTLNISSMPEKYMQKSKSASNVGHIVSRKILRGRSKSQSRLISSQPVSKSNKWEPTEKCTWMSENGDCLHLSDVLLQNLSEIEMKYLQRVAVDKISELNVGIKISLDSDESTQKRRIVPKKKALTTNFFEMGRKDDTGKNAGTFGNSLESCVANDKKISNHERTFFKDRGSRNSISSLFKSGIENVRSCESLPSSSNSENIGMSIGKFNNIAKSSSMLMSSSQWNIRRKSKDFCASDEFSDVEYDLQVPSFFSRCIQFLEEHGLHKVGLFRVSTSRKRVKQMREEFNKSLTQKIQANTCPHDVATLLKEFLRDLPEPLLCSNLYNAFLQTQKIRNRRLQLEAISHLIKLLPRTHRDTLYILLRFLAQVAAHSDDVINPDGSVYISGNKMDSNNLATVFAPNILRKSLKNENVTTFLDNSSGALSEQESMSDSINVIRTMIDHYDDLFRVPADLIDVVYSYMLDECPEQLFELCEQHIFTVKNDFNLSVSPLTSPDEVKGNIRGEEQPLVSKSHTRCSLTHENNAFNEDNNSLRESVGQKGSRRYAEIRGRHNSDNETTERRKSSPNVLARGNIISGSLKISAPQQVSNLTNMDAVNQENASLSSKESVNNRTKGMIVFDLKFGPSSKAVDPTKSLTNEPKLPTSISNIGGAILRSKTADFERMSHIKTITPKTKNELKSCTSSTQPITRQHLYKRQELISSSKGIDSQ